MNSKCTQVDEAVLPTKAILSHLQFCSCTVLKTPNAFVLNLKTVKRSMLTLTNNFESHHYQNRILPTALTLGDIASFLLVEAGLTLHDDSSVQTLLQ